MKINDNQQQAINEVARQVYLAKKANDAKDGALDGIREMIAKNEDTFRSGVAASFDCEGRHITAQLVLKPSPKWQVKDLVVTVA